MFDTNNPHSASSELPDLISFLDVKYQEVTDTSLSFKDFCTKYLEENRPSEVFPVDDNYGILLTNGQRVKLCPGVEGRESGHTGDMANPGKAIDITRRSVR